MTLRVLAHTPLPKAGAAGRYRVFQYVQPLHSHGIELRVEPFFDDAAFAQLYPPGGMASMAWDLARFIPGLRRRLMSPEQCDVVLVHRELWSLAGGWPLAMVRAAESA